MELKIQYIQMLQRFRGYITIRDIWNSLMLHLKEIRYRIHFV